MFRIKSIQIKRKVWPTHSKKKKKLKETISEETQIPDILLMYNNCELTVLLTSSVQSLSRVRLFVTPWTIACKASLSIIKSWSLLRLTSIELVMPPNHLVLCHPLFLLPSIFPRIRVFSNESVVHTGGQSIGISASASVLQMNIQD